MATRWTERQRDAIQTRDKALLVSAAAGSGKTATLTERIIQSILDKDKPADISRMLIVTFTRAAAAELRERISAAIGRALENDPSNRHLSRQALLISSAQICTIDSFCHDILSAHTAEVGLASSYRICDEAEGALLEHKVMEEIVENAFEGIYSDINKNDFALFAEGMTAAKEEGELSERLIRLYSKTAQLPDRSEVYTRILGILEQNPRVFDTPWGKCLQDKIRDFCTHYGTLCKELLEKMSEYDADAEIKYSKCFSHVAEKCGECIDALGRGYDEAAAAFSALCDLPPKKSNREKERSVYSFTAEVLHANLVAETKTLKGLFVYTAADYARLHAQMRDFYKITVSVFEKYEKRLDGEKRQRGILNFDDVSRHTLRLLCDEEGNPTDIARTLADGYDYVYIDEYQDVNYIQHKIFECVSRENNRFMVGDIKQSIYGFRGGEPDIFAKLRKDFPALGTGEGGTASIFMSDNFRCDESIITFVNAIFDTLFGIAGDSIGYEAQDALRFSKKSDPPTHGRVTVRLFNPRTGKRGEPPAEPRAEGEEAGAELEYVANEIVRLISSEVKNDNTPITPRDIAVIFRSGAHKADALRRMLEARGIGAHTANKDNFFLSSDVLLMLSILNMIDNPRRDVQLAGAMRSPVFGFSMDELLAARAEFPDAPTLYDAFSLYCTVHPEYEKGAHFLKTLANFRDFARGRSVDRLISLIYTETNILSVAERRDRLMLLYNYAIRFEASSFKGLYNFISFVDQIIAGERKISLGETVEGGDSVTIISAHSSKGLEFPVCFFCDAGAAHSVKDTRQSVLFDPQLGIITRFLDESGLLCVDNPIFSIFADKMKRRQAEEEMRVLYVALTRARERLYVTATPRKKVDNLLKDAEGMARYADKYHILGETSNIALIMLALTLNPDAATVEIERTRELDGKAATVPDAATTSENTKIFDEAVEKSDLTIGGDSGHTSADFEKIARLAQAIRENLAYEYPHAHLGKIPGKLSVSRLYPEVLDEAEENEVTTVTAREVTGKIPLFMSANTEEAGGAERGSATHLFLQFCDFEGTCKNGVEAEISRLTENGFITKRDAELIRRGELARFFESTLFAQMRNARRIWRELRFNMNLPAAAFTADGELAARLGNEPLLVQGVIDCVFETKDGSIILCDYKTDRVPQSRDEAYKILRERHKSQLGYYALVCEKMFGRMPKRVYIYSLALGESVEI